MNMTKALGILKFIIGILLLPVLVATSFSFYQQLVLLEKEILIYFIWGVVSYLILHLFIWEPAVIYRKGQRILGIIFRFFAPLVKFASYLFPIYTILIFILYSIISLFFKSKELLNYFMFLFGFSLTLHIIFSAKSLRSKQEDFLKSNYIFGFSFIYITNIVLFCFCLNLVFQRFSFLNFFNQTYSVSKDIYSAVFGQLFF